ncbi:MAG: HAD hydrolase-like protein [Spirochaetales bacterium]|nr:HAD hydrolase-like protein [Spirochaetales bacterium]
MIKYVIFDLADTLVRGLTGIGEGLSDNCAPTPKDHIVDCLRGEEMTDFLLGRTTEDDYLGSLIRKYHWSIDLDSLKKTIRRHFDEAIPGMAELVRQLSGKYSLVLLSNHGREWVEYIEKKHRFLDLIRRRFYSFDLKCLKNTPEIFLRVLAALNAEPTECMFIDDRETVTQTARGLDAIRFTDAETLKDELRRRGIRLV